MLIKKKKKKKKKKKERNLFNDIFKQLIYFNIYIIIIKNYI